MPNRTLRLCVVLAFGTLALCTTGVAWAEGVYVPVATSVVDDGEFNQTRLLVTNEGTEARRFRARFIPTNTDGVPPEGDPIGDLISVQPGSTLVMASVAPEGQAGILELDGAPQLSFAAELVRRSASGGIRTVTPIPVVGLDQVANAEEAQEILGLGRSLDGETTDVGVVTFGAEPAQCDISLFRADSGQVAQTAVITVPASGHRQFDAAFNILGVEEIALARMNVKCSQPFYAYALNHKVEPEDTVFLSPATNASRRVGPGAPGSVGILRLNGEFFRSTLDEPVFRVPLDNIQPGVQYSLITFEFDMRVERYRGPLFNAVFNFVRNGGPLYGALFIRGDRNKTILDLGNEREVQGPTNWSERTNYHVEFTYDVAAGRATLLVFRGGEGGELIQQVTGGITNSNVSHNGQGINLIFGLSRIFDGAFYPPLNWRYSNLEVQAFPLE
ncbi:MAG: hypothetical protein AAF481_05815 [Acidobacteriota bacterium]